VIAGVNVITADSDDEAQQEMEITRRARVKRMFSRGGQPLTDEEADAVLRSPQAAHVDQMMRYTAVGTPATVATHLDEFAAHADADELMTVHAASTRAGRVRSVELTATAVGAARSG
jgi:alkanesulfonate monooxygenase SsuD/methylene tetrahydromethanopterin reductase-like flavin-dependent oxidoreductase (luciferase family)